MGLSTEGLVCFCFQSRKVLDNGPTEKSGAQTSSGLSSNVSTRKCGESVLKSTFSLQDVERAIKLKYPFMMKHFCLGLGCPYLSGFQLWNTDTFYECFLLCLYIVDHFASRQFIFSCQGKLKKVNNKLLSWIQNLEVQCRIGIDDGPPAQEIGKGFGLTDISVTGTPVCMH